MKPRTAPAVSVLMTSWRTPADLLTTSLASVLAQTDPDLELVLVLDGPPDDASRDVVARHAGDSRVVVLEPGRVGRGRALNVALEVAAGDWVAIQDADDESHPERLRRQRLVLESHPEIDLLGAAARETTRADEHADWTLPAVPAPPRALGDELLRSNPVVHSSVIVRRELVDRAGRYAVSRRRHFDYDLYLRLRDLGGVLAVTDDPLVLHRRHAGQAFERDTAALDRAWQALRLQAGHAGDLPPLRRVAHLGVIGVRQVGHLARVVARRPVQGP